MQNYTFLKFGRKRYENLVLNENGLVNFIIESNEIQNISQDEIPVLLYTKLSFVYKIFSFMYIKLKTQGFELL